MSLVEGMKFDDGKLRYNLIDGPALAWLAGILTYGAAKYEAENWRKVADANERYYSALMRHVELWRAGEADDEESGMPHLSGAFFSVMCLLALNGPRDFKEIATRTKVAVGRALEAWRARTNVT